MRSKRWASAVAAMFLAVAPVAPAGRASADGWSNGTDRIGDGVFDVSDPRADVTSASLSAAGDGRVVGSMTVRVYSDPLTDPNWVVNITAPAWHFDVDFDGEKDFWAAVYHQNGELVGAVLDAAGRLVCAADATTQPGRKSYGVAFDRACIGSPARFQWRAVMGLDLGTHMLFDLAPDLGWEGPVVDTRPVPPPAGELTSVVPARVYDSRIDGITIDGDGRGDGRRIAGSVTQVVVAGRADVPADVSAVMLNVTAVQPIADGYLTVWPCGAEQPVASHVNYRANQIVPNAVLAKVGDGGAVCIATLSSTDLVVDLNGYVPAGASPEPLVPERVYDSRITESPADQRLDVLDVLDDDDSPAGGRRAPGSVTSLRVTGRHGVPDHAVAVMLNVTAVLPTADGYLTVWPCGEPAPVASSVNFRVGQVVPNAVLAKVGQGGAVCITTTADTDIVVDVNGFVPGDGSLAPVTPARVLETRPASAGSTVDGQFAALGRRGTRSVTEVVVAGRGGVPSDATSVMLNVTAVLPSADSYLTVWPCGAPQPLASHVNYRAGQVVPNAVLTRIGTGGKVCIATLAPTDIVVDVNGYV